MARWVFEPGHTAAEFCSRHMMVCFVRGHFKRIEGVLEFDLEHPVKSSVEVRIPAGGIWSGDKDRDDHLKSVDFLDVENYPEITFRGDEIEVLSSHDYSVTGDLTIRGVTQRIPLKVTYLGQWGTPWWEGGEDKGPKTRAGFVATTTIDRHQFGVSWNGSLDKGGIVVGNEVEITIDVEAILEEEEPG